MLVYGIGMARDKENDLWFGPHPSIGELPAETAASILRELGDSAGADELAAASSGAAGHRGTFGASGGDILGRLFNRFIKTTHICGFLADGDGDQLLPVTRVKPDEKLKGAALKVTLDGLHVARYPGFGTHRLLFDFALEAQAQQDKSDIFHYNARFEAHDGETVPVRNFPLFYGMKPSTEGLTFGFQTVNVASSFDEGLLDFLKRDEFKKGLQIAASMTPVLGQISEMAASLTSWLAGQSKNAKVQEFRQGLDFGSRKTGGGLASGSYLVVQIPLDYQREWNWSDWTVDPQLVRLVQRKDPAQSLDFNHVIFGLHRME